jgi:hypothetical protein
MTDIRLYKVIITFEDGAVAHCAAIDYQGAIWLVPKWLPSPDERYTKSERMIRLDQFKHQRYDPPAPGPPPFDGADFALNEPIPRALIDGELSQKLKERYAVLDKPDVKFRLEDITRR